MLRRIAYPFIREPGLPATLTIICVCGINRKDATAQLFQTYSVLCFELIVSLMLSYVDHLDMVVNKNL